MNLSTLFFVFAFLPVSLILYLLCPRVCKNALLILVSFSMSPAGTKSSGFFFIIPGRTYRCSQRPDAH